MADIAAMIATDSATMYSNSKVESPADFLRRVDMVDKLCSQTIFVKMIEFFAFSL